jgi:hypothetical protein
MSATSNPAQKIKAAFDAKKFTPEAAHYYMPRNFDAHLPIFIGFR